MAMIDNFVREFEKCLGKPAGSVKATTTLAEVPELDSLGRLSVIAMVDVTFKVALRPEWFDTCATVADLYAAMSRPAT